MIKLQSENSPLEDMEGFSFLHDNYSSNITSFVVTNADDFSVDDYIKLGVFGAEASELAKITGLDKSTNTIEIETATRFAHPESTKVTKMRYNMIKWCRGTGPDYDNPPTAVTELREWQKIGDNTTQWDITDEGSDRFKYQWDGTGKKPRILDYFPYPVPTPGSIDITVTTSAENFNSANNVVNHMVYEIGEDASGNGYFVITNASGVAESNVTTGNGYIQFYTNHLDIKVDSIYTSYKDLVNTTGFGFWSWYNATDYITTINKSPIPYAGFPPNTAKAIIDDFYSTLNTKEIKLVTRVDAFRWLSEGYSVALNELNMVNKEYSAVLPLNIPTVSGTREYALPANFSKILSINGVNNADTTENFRIDAIRQDEIDEYEESDPSVVKYYLRGVKDFEVDDVSDDPYAEMYVGFSPVPSSVTNYQIRYIPKSVAVTKNYDAIFLPNNNYYCLKDYLLFRAAPKLGRGDGSAYFQLFQAEMDRMKVNSMKQDGTPASWASASNTLV